MSSNQRSEVSPRAPLWPQIVSIGVDGFSVRFAETLSEPANRAALAFRTAIENAGWSEVVECATALVSTYVRFDVLGASHRDMATKLANLVASQDWYAAPLSGKRALWRVPTVFGSDLAPQLAEAAALAGVDEATAIADISARPIRVQTIGFAPGMPYLGELPGHWNIPRQSSLTPTVPVGAVTVAIRQIVLFTVSTPTGWRHIGQTGFRPFQPEEANPFLLRPGDEVLFAPTTREAYERLLRHHPNGGATREALS